MKKIFVVIVCLLLTGCSNANKVDFTEYESIKYGEKIIEVVEQYQMGDLTRIEAEEKLETLADSIEMVAEDDKETCLNNSKSEDNAELIKLHSEVVEGAIISFARRTELMAIQLDEPIKTKESKKELKEQLTELKKHIEECS